jgi:transposase
MRLPTLERDEWVSQYFDVLARGFAAQPLPALDEPPKRRGRRKQTSSKNLLDDLVRRADQVLAFLDDLSIPFTNNQAERDLRMVKVQQKIAGTFRSDAGITAFCRMRSAPSHDAQTRPGHAGCAGGGLCRPSPAHRLGTLRKSFAAEDGPA